MSNTVNGLTSDQIATEVALDLADGSCVNLGIGMPGRVASFVPAGREVIIHTENGALGAGPRPPAGEEDWDLIDAGKNPMTLRAGGSFVSHFDSFAMIRGGHIDVSVIGAYQVSATGDLANWTDGEGIPGVGGAMDLAHGAKQVFVMMRHITKDGRPKLVTECSLPLTGRTVVTRVFTELGIFAPGPDGFTVIGLTRGIDPAVVRSLTDAPLRFPDRPTWLPRSSSQ
ncbi:MULTISPECIES: 3-oxoacid CoA-transferase subunit B [Bacillati]|uniref:3-oxoacid CoA-transferase subunit B n=1 Tax=Bacillus cereus TaxID=1396 RepID=UPI00362AA28D